MSTFKFRVYNEIEVIISVSDLSNIENENQKLKALNLRYRELLTESYKRHLWVYEDGFIRDEYDDYDWDDFGKFLDKTCFVLNTEALKEGE